MSDTRRRVKVYTLNEERQWEDRGTGHVCCSEAASLTVTGEADGKRRVCRSSRAAPRRSSDEVCCVCSSVGSVLLESRISPDTAYQKQQVRPAAFLQECVVLQKSKHSSDVSVRLSCDPAAQNQAYASES